MSASASRSISFGTPSNSPPHSFPPELAKRNYYCLKPQTGGPALPSSFTTSSTFEAPSISPLASAVSTSALTERHEYTSAEVPKKLNAVYTPPTPMDSPKATNKKIAEEENFEYHITTSGAQWMGEQTRFTSYDTQQPSRKSPVQQDPNTTLPITPQHSRTLSSVQISPKPTPGPPFTPISTPPLSREVSITTDETDLTIDTPSGKPKRSAKERLVRRKEGKIPIEGIFYQSHWEIFPYERKKMLKEKYKISLEVDDDHKDFPRTIKCSQANQDYWVDRLECFEYEFEFAVGETETAKPRQAEVAATSCNAKANKVMESSTTKEAPSTKRSNQNIDEAEDTSHKYWVTWDYRNGLVRMAEIFKCYGYNKAHIGAAIKETKTTFPNPERPGEWLTLRYVSLLNTGGIIETQGYWVPYEAAKEMLGKFCYDIREPLSIIFGWDIVDKWTPPTSPPHPENSKLSFRINDSTVKKCYRIRNHHRQRLHEAAKFGVSEVSIAPKARTRKSKKRKVDESNIQSEKVDPTLAPVQNSEVVPTKPPASALRGSINKRRRLSAQQAANIQPPHEAQALFSSAESFSIEFEYDPSPPKLAPATRKRKRAAAEKPSESPPPRKKPNTFSHRSTKRVVNPNSPKTLARPAAETVSTTKCPRRKTIIRNTRLQSPTSPTLCNLPATQEEFTPLTETHPQPLAPPPQLRDPLAIHNILNPINPQLLPIPHSFQDQSMNNHRANTRFLHHGTNSREAVRTQSPSRWLNFTPSWFEQQKNTLAKIRAPGNIFSGATGATLPSINSLPDLAGPLHHEVQNSTGSRGHDPGNSDSAGTQSMREARASFERGRGGMGSEREGEGMRRNSSWNFYSNEMDMALILLQLAEGRG